MSEEEAPLLGGVGEILLGAIKMATAYMLHAGKRRETEQGKERTSDPLQMLWLALQGKKKLWHCLSLSFVVAKA